MQNSNAFEHDIESQLARVGGEALDGSGFEDELPESGFAPNLSEEE